MRIHGKTFKEIFALLHWTQKIIVVAGAVFIGYAVFFWLWLATRAAIENATAKKAQVLTIGSSARDATGTLDPSIVIDGAGNRALMAFTGMAAAQDGALEMNVYLAAGQKDCTKFSRLDTPVISGRKDDILAPDGETVLGKGRWRVETPALVHDPADTKMPWKIFAYRYFWADDAAKAVPFARLFGGIVMTGTTDPIGGPWSREAWALSASKDVPPFPYNTLAPQKINNLSPQLADVYFYARPSIAIVNDVYFMTLSAFIKGKDTADRLVLLASADRGRNWSYAGTPLNAQSVAGLGFAQLQGGTLIQAGGKVYLAAVLGDEKVTGQGTFIFGFDSLPRASLVNDAQGKPAVLKHIELSSNAPSPVGGGFATFSPECRGGLITSEFSSLRGNYFIFETFESPVP